MKKLISKLLFVTLTLTVITITPLCGGRSGDTPGPIGMGIKTIQVA